MIPQQWSNLSHSGKLSLNELAGDLSDQPRSEVTPISLEESEFLFRSTSKQDVTQKSEASTPAARAYKAKTMIGCMELLAGPGILRAH